MCARLIWRKSAPQGWPRITRPITHPRVGLEIPRRRKPVVIVPRRALTMDRPVWIILSQAEIIRRRLRTGRGIPGSNELRLNKHLSYKRKSRVLSQVFSEVALGINISNPKRGHRESSNKGKLTGKSWIKPFIIENGRHERPGPSVQPGPSGWS